MVHERDAFPVARQLRVADVAGRLVDDFADRELDPSLPADVANDQHVRAVRSPVRFLNVFRHVPRRSARQSRARESSGAHRWVRAAAVDVDRHLARGRNRQQVRARQLQGQRFGARGVFEEQLAGIAVPGGAVDDGLSVRSEPRGLDRPAPEGDLLEGRRCRAREAPPDRRPSRERRRETGGDEHGGKPASLRTRRGGRRRPGHHPRDVRFGEMLPHRADVPGQVARRGVAFLGILLQAALDDPAERRRHGGVELRDGLGVLADDGRQGLGLRSALEGALARRHLVEDRAHRELVGAVVERAAAGLLRRHVPDGPHHRAGLRGLRGRGVGDLVRLLLEELGEAEVEDLEGPVLRDHHVFGLEVPVDDPGRVRLGEAVRELVAQVEQPPRRQGSGAEDLAQRPAVDELHRDVDGVSLSPDVVDRDDVRMVERRGRARLLLEALLAVRVGRELRRQHLDGDLAPQTRVARPVHLSHASGARGARGSRRARAWFLRRSP